MKEFLESKGYHHFDSGVTNGFSKPVESEALCETNHKLNIVVNEWTPPMENYPSSTSVGIRAEKHGIWWNLQAYSLGEGEIYERLEEIEKDLIRIFNSL